MRNDATLLAYATQWLARGVYMGLMVLVQSGYEWLTNALLTSGLSSRKLIGQNASPALSLRLLFEFVYGPAVEQACWADFGLAMNILVFQMQNILIV